MKQVLITGATGVVGPNVVSRLVAEGYRVRVLSRYSVPAGLLPSDVEVMQGDIADPERVRRAVDSVALVFHLAAKLHTNTAAPSLLSEYRRVNVEGTQVLAEAAQEAGVARLVFFSTVAVYGRSQPGEVLDEDSPLAPASIYGLTKCEAESIVLSLLCRDATPRAVVLRLASVYGPRMKGNYRHLVAGLRQGWFVPLGNGANRRTLVHEFDVAEAAWIAAHHTAAAGRIYNVTDGSIHRFDEIVDAISVNLGRSPPRLRIPTRPLIAAARVIDTGMRLGGGSRRLTPLIAKLVEDMAVSGQRIQSELGFRPRIDLCTGWARTAPAIAAGWQRSRS